MASTVNSAPTGNNTSGNASSQNSSGRASLRPSASTRVPDSRRQSPVDGGTRRSNSQKAWTQGTNPITQRYSQQNGNMPHQKQSASPRPAPKESNTSDNHAHDRLIFLVTSFIGLNAVVTTKAGEIFTGIFSSSTLEASESSFVLKMVQRASKQDQQGTNGVSDGASPFLGTAPNHSMAFDAKEVVDISVANVSPADVTTKPSNGASAGFRTDTDISGNLAIRERTLKRWEPAADDTADMSLESSTNVSGWDQFETNERMFGGRSNYDESFYTTTINRADPTYKQKEADAARIAREIEGTDADNVHVREERGLAPTGGTGEDEEEKYSGVRRDEKNFPPLVSGQPNKYTPPARRQAAPPSAATAGAPAKQPVATTSGAVPAQAQPKEPVPSQPQQAQPAATAKTTTEAPQKSVPDKAVASSTTTAPKRAGADNATANVETEVLDHFRQFANSEKLKMQERRRNQASYDRNIKLNELLKFSKNFKLATPVPKDLVPILAKDPHKQETIITRAQLQSEEEEKPNTQATPATDEQKPVTHAPAPGRYESGTMPPHTQYNRGRQVYTPTGPNAAGQGGRFQNQNTQPGRPGTGMLSHRLADNLQQRKGAAAGPVPTPLPINDARLPPTGPAGERSALTSPSKSQTPASSKFNVRALEFKPNPAASTFTPGGGSGAAASPQPLFRGRSISRASSPSAFFGAKKPRPVAERASLTDQFNPIKRMKKESSEQTDKDFSFNGGIPPAYRTLPTWDVPAGNEEKTYPQMFKPVNVPAVPQHRAASNPQMPHQPQMPFPFQQPGMPPVSGPPGPHLHPQQHHSGPPHFDDPHRMQLSSSTSQIFPSPRLQHNHVAYPSPMAPHAQLAFQQPGMPQFYVNQGAPQPPHMRHYPGAPQFMNPQGAMAAPMMVQQPSSGPYMGVPQGMAPYTPQMQMYSPSPGHAYPQHAPPPQPQSGFPSPSRGAPMMMHQNSQSGQPPQPVMFMGQPGQPMYPGQQPGHMPPVRGNYQQQPQFQSSPHQGHQYPPHQHRTPSSGYNQVPQMAPQLPPSQPPPTVASGPHPPEAAADEVK